MAAQVLARESHSPQETEKIAADLAATLAGGDCIALRGELGAGKTCFVRGLAAGLGANPRSVSSPTFILLNIYSGGRLTLYHLDAYRTHGPEDFAGIGFSELLEQGGIVAVEWAERIESLLPARRIDIMLKALDEQSRRIEIARPG